MPEERRLVICFLRVTIHLTCLGKVLHSNGGTVVNG